MKVITMEMLGKIRRMALRNGVSLHEISRRIGLSGNTVRKWLGEATLVAPKYKRQAY
jgi:transposase-like protein